MPPPTETVRRLDLFAFGAMIVMCQDSEFQNKLSKYCKEHGTNYYETFADWCYDLAQTLQTKSETM